MNKTVTMATAFLALLGTAGVASAQDVTAGEKVFKKCKACHRVGEEAKNVTGPQLNNIIGRPAASVEGYKYGESIKQAGAAGLIWSEELILVYITDPRAFLRDYLDDPKAKANMKFKLKKEQERLDVLAYLKTFSPDEETE